MTPATHKEWQHNRASIESVAVQLHDPRKADRVEAANFLGIDRVSTIRLEDLTEAEIRVYIIADNRLAEKVGSEPCRQA